MSEKMTAVISLLLQIPSSLGMSGMLAVNQKNQRLLVHVHLVAGLLFHIADNITMFTLSPALLYWFFLLLTYVVVILTVTDI